jgi:hypothetical protein
MYRFDGRSHCLGVRFRPPKASRQPLKKIFNVLAFGLILALVVLRAGRIWIVLGHGNLTVAIVGEFTT